MFRFILATLLLTSLVAEAHPPRRRDHGPGPVVVHGPRRPGPAPGPVVVGPVRRSHKRVRTGPIVVMAPRAVHRHWLRHPNVVIVRNYPIAITPIYVPLIRPIIVVGQPYSETVKQGELWPSDTDYMLYFSHYSFSMERHFNQFGQLAETSVSLYPQYICQDPNGCGYLTQPAPQRLRVTNITTDACGVQFVTAIAYDQFALIQSVQLTDYSGFFCGANVSPNMTYFEVAGSVVHYGGFAETNLTGNRTY